MFNYNCESCKNTDPGRFVHDNRTADIICTTCGVVQRHMNSNINNTTFTEPLEIRAHTTTQKKFMQLNNQMMSHVCPDETRDMRRNAVIKDYCEKLELTTGIETRARLLFDNNKKALSSIRPLNNVIASCIAIACQSLKRYINVGDIEALFSLSNVNKTLRMVCNVVGINRRAMVLNAVPYIISTIGLPFKYQKKLIDLYKLMCKKNPSIGSDTRMALCCYKLYVDNKEKSKFKKEITLENIASITNTSENSLKSYVSGKTSNYLFETKKRKIDDERKKK